MIWLVIRTIIRHLLRDLEARHTLVYDVAHSLAHDTAYDSPVIRPTPGGKRSACPAFCRRAEHFFTVPPQICDAFYVTICGIFFSALFSIGRPSARFGDPRPLVLPGCPALAGHRSEREPPRCGVCCGEPKKVPLRHLFGTGVSLFRFHRSPQPEHTPDRIRLCGPLGPTGPCRALIFA